MAPPAIASATGSYTGYSFAIPVNIVKKVTRDLVEFGSVQRAYLGVSIRDLDTKLAQELDMDRPRGVYVNGTTEGGAAEKAGVAIVLRPPEQEPERVREALATILEDGHITDRAGRLAEEIARMPIADEVAAQLELLPAR